MRHAVLAATLAACTGGTTTGNTSQSCAALAQTTATPSPAFTGSVFTIVMENKSRGDILGNRSAPYINELAAHGAVARGYHDAYIHPSEPNYLWMVAGENFGVLDDQDPAAHPIESTSHLADQLELAGVSWKTYQESMDEPCGLTSHGRYAAKHDPFVYFDDVNGWDGTTFQPSTRCDEHVVDYAQLSADIAAGAVPRYVFITPDLDHDMHDGSVAAGDAWLAREVPKIMATDAYQHGGVIFLLWDEGSGTLGPGDDPPFIAVSPLIAPGTVSTASYDTSSYLKTVQTILGVEPLPCATDPAAVPAMTDLFTAAM